MPFTLQILIIIYVQKLLNSFIENNIHHELLKEYIKYKS